MFDWFAIGMALAVASSALAHASRPPRLVARRPVACWAIAVFLFVLAGALDRENPGLSRISAGVWLGEHLLYGGVALFVVLPAVFGDDQGGRPTTAAARKPDHRLARARVVRHIPVALHDPLAAEQVGRDPRSHRLYFLPIFLAALAVSAATATISYYAVERPFLRLKEKRTPELLALPIVFLLVLAAGVGQGKKRPAPAPPTACLIVKRYDVLPASCRPASAGGHPAKLVARSILTDGRQLPIVQGWIVSSVDLSQIVANGFLGKSARIVGWADKAVETSGYVVELPLGLVRRRGKTERLQLVGVEGNAASLLPFDCKPKPQPLGC